MAQYLKEDVRERILAAALRVFAARGFEPATMSEIARKAAISTGNVYRYFPDKETLFHTVVPEPFVDRFVGLLRKRVRSLAGVADVRRLGTGSVFRLASEELLAFSLANRLRVVVLLRGPKGTGYEQFPARLVAEMQRLAFKHFRQLDPGVRNRAALRFGLEQVYRNWVGTLTEILAASDEERVIRERLDAFSRYHLAGMNGLFGRVGAARS